VTNDQLLRLILTSRVSEIAVETKRIAIHAFDDPLVIAGQGRVGPEILAQGRNDLDAIFAPIGGGGLIAQYSANASSGKQ